MQICGMLTSVGYVPVADWRRDVTNFLLSQTFQNLALLLRTLDIRPPDILHKDNLIRVAIDAPKAHSTASGNGGGHP